MARRSKIVYQDGFLIESHTHFTWLDRLRILFGCRVTMRTEIVTQFHCGHSQSSSTYIIEKFLPEGVHQVRAKLTAKNTMDKWNYLPIKSSNLQEAAYDGGKLRVKFKNGTYEYEGVTPQLWEKFSATFQSSESTGEFFNQNIKPLKFTKV